MPVLQIALFFLLVKCAVKASGRNCRYFYPKACLDEAQRRGIANREAEMKKGSRFMAFFCTVMLLALLAIVALGNRVSAFGTAGLQTCLFLVVMNWFDGIVIAPLGRPKQNLARRGHGGRSLRQALAGSPRQARPGHGDLPDPRAVNRRNRAADRENRLLSKSRRPSSRRAGRARGAGGECTPAVNSHGADGRNPCSAGGKSMQRVPLSGAVRGPFLRRRAILPPKP